MVVWKPDWKSLLWSKMSDLVFMWSAKQAWANQEKFSGKYGQLLLENINVHFNTDNYFWKLSVIVRNYMLAAKFYRDLPMLASKTCDLTIWIPDSHTVQYLGVQYSDGYCTYQFSILNKIFFQSRPFTWCCVFVVVSSNQPFVSWPRSTTRTRWFAESATLDFTQGIINWQNIAWLHPRY